MEDTNVESFCKISSQIEEVKLLTINLLEGIIF